MEAIEAEVHKLIECGFIQEGTIQIGLLILSPFLKRMEKSGFVLTTAILIQLALKMNFHCPSQCHD